MWSSVNRSSDAWWRVKDLNLQTHNQDVLSLIFVVDVLQVAINLLG